MKSEERQKAECPQGGDQPTAAPVKVFRCRPLRDGATGPGGRRLKTSGGGNRGAVGLGCGRVRAMGIWRGGAALDAGPLPGSTRLAGVLMAAAQGTGCAERPTARSGSGRRAAIGLTSASVSVAARCSREALVEDCEGARGGRHDVSIRTAVGRARGAQSSQRATWPPSAAVRQPSASPLHLSFAERSLWQAPPGSPTRP